MIQRYFEITLRYFEIALRHFEIALRHFRHHPALLRDRVRRGMNTRKAQSFAK